MIRNFLAMAFLAIQCTPIFAAPIVEIKKFAGKSESEVSKVLGPSSKCEAIKQSKRCAYRNGQLEIVFISEKADWMTIKGMEKTPFSPVALTAIGLMQREPTLSTPYVMRWEPIDGFKSVSIFKGETGGHYAYVRTKHLSNDVSTNDKTGIFSGKVRATSSNGVNALAKPATGTDKAQSTSTASSIVVDGGTVNMNHCKPDYPKSSKRNEETGRVTLTVKVSPTGHVVQSYVHRSTGYRDLDTAALKALSTCTFSPATVDGIAVDTSLEVFYVFNSDS